MAIAAVWVDIVGSGGGRRQPGEESQAEARTEPEGTRGFPSYAVREVVKVLGANWTRRIVEGGDEDAATRVSRRGR